MTPALRPVFAFTRSYNVADGIVKNSDGSVVFTVGTKSYVLAPVSKDEIAADYAALDVEIHKDQVGPIEAVLPELERLAAFPKYQEALLDRAYKDLRKGKTQRNVTNDEIRNFIDTLPGLVFVFGRMFRRKYPELTDGDILEIINKVGSAEMEKARDELSKKSLMEIVPNLGG